MTGQVKEQIIARLGELAIRVIDGCLTVQPGLLPEDELFGSAGSDGVVRFTVCSVPMSVRLGPVDEVEFVADDGSVTTTEGAVLPAKLSAAVFGRDQRIAEVRWTVAR